MKTVPDRALPDESTWGPAQFLLAHINPRFASDTNMDVGEFMIALAYPKVVIIRSGGDSEKRWVDVAQPGVEIAEDLYPIGHFLQRFPHVCRAILEADEDLRRAYRAWRR